MVCPLGADCDAVVKSEFSTFAGVSLEIAGGLYYLASLVAYVGLLIWQPAGETMLQSRFLLSALGGVAFLFSCYLTFVQAFYIKSWCSWCLTSAAATTAMFLLAIAGDLDSGSSFLPLLNAWRDGITALHLVGFGVGIAAVTVADLLFFRYMRDFYVSPEERRTLRVLSQIIWVGLGAVVISAIGLYIPASAGVGVPFFWPEIAVLLVVAANGAFLNLLVMPKLCDAASNHRTLRVAEVAGLRRVAFGSGAVSFVSWYVAFLTVVLAETGTLQPKSFFLYYIAALLVALVGSQILERRHYAEPLPL